MGSGRALALRKKRDPFKSQCAEDREEREKKNGVRGSSKWKALPRNTGVVSGGKGVRDQS